MMYPMEPVHRPPLRRGLEEILVVEEKRSFIEMFLRDTLYNDAAHPRIVGKRDEQGRPLVPANGELDADRIAQLGGQPLERKLQIASVTSRVALLEALRERPARLTLARPAYFCSGCPHNRSTVVPEGSMAAAGIGCHGMALGIPERRTAGLTHMGGEGAQWVGMAPFTKTPHMFQNLGDGTFFHSGSLAVRQAVAAGTNVTYKLLYNSAVAMTGGQDAAGATPVPELTRILEAEGAKRIIVMTDEPDKYGPEARWAQGVEVWHRDRLDEAQRMLRDIPGVTVLVYDQRCAAEKRRLRKRGKLPDPAMRVVINEAVCEGCGDCGVKSNCLSVHPVETEFGRKTQIHQSSCNKDYSCLRGDCPSFLTVVPLGALKKRDKKIYTVDRALPEPVLRVPQNANVFMMGIGGTGVVTVNQVLGTAALLDGKVVRGLDQTGAQPEGRPGRLPSEDPHGRRGSLEQGRRRLGRLLPGLRRAGGDRAAESRPRTARPHHRRRVDQSGADRLHGHAHRSAIPRRRRTAELDQTGSRARTRMCTSTPWAWPRRSSTTTWRPTCWCSAPPTRRAPFRSAPRPSRKPSSSTPCR
jgi:indolepyruvate ferredoxin oxidoreductase